MQEEKTKLLLQLCSIINLLHSIDDFNDEIAHRFWKDTNEMNDHDCNNLSSHEKWLNKINELNGLIQQKAGMKQLIGNWKYELNRYTIEYQELQNKVNLNKFEFLLPLSKPYFLLNCDN